MLSKGLTSLTLLTAIFSINANAGSDPYWEYMAQSVARHPAYQVFLSSRDSAASLLNIEEARRYPKVEGVLSRVDGASNLTETPSAWQAGLSLTYSLYDNRRQDARDQIARSQGQQELTSAAQSTEKLMIDLANAHIRMWEAAESIKILKHSSRRVHDLQERMQEQVKAGETSVLLLSKFVKMGLDIKTKLLDAQQRLESATQTWAMTGIKPANDVLLPPMTEVPIEDGAPANLRRLQAELARADSEHALAKRDEGMSVNLQASSLIRKYQSQAELSTNQIWQLNASYPLYDGGLARSKTQREALNLLTKQAAVQAEKAETQLELGRLQAWLASMRDIIASFEQQCAIQHQIADSIQTRFSLGRGSLTEVTEGFLSAQDCSLAVIRNRADYYTKYHDFSKLNGTLAALIMDRKP